MSINNHIKKDTINKKTFTIKLYWQKKRYK